MGVLGKLHVIGVPVGLATVFVPMDVRLCHRHLHTIRDRRASGQCDTPGPSFWIFPAGQPKCKHHGRCRLCGHECPFLKQVFVIFLKPKTTQGPSKSQGKHALMKRTSWACENFAEVKSKLQLACHPTEGWSHQGPPQPTGWCRLLVIQLGRSTCRRRSRPWSTRPCRQVAMFETRKQIAKN